MDAMSVASEASALKSSQLVSAYQVKLQNSAMHQDEQVIMALIQSTAGSSPSREAFGTGTQINVAA